MEHMQK